MDLIAAARDVLANAGIYVIPFLIILSVVVFVHELGHYLVARWNGVRVQVFSIGFGPELFGINDRAGTRWSSFTTATRPIRSLRPTWSSRRSEWTWASTFRRRSPHSLPAN